MQNATAAQVPTTGRELRALSMQRDEMFNQIQELQVQHGRLIQERHNATATNSTKEVAEFTERIAEVGARIRRLEQQQASAEDAINQALVKGIGLEEAPGGGGLFTTITLPPPFETPSRPDIEGRAEERAAAVAGGVLALTLLGYALYRWGKRSARKLAGAPGTTGNQDLKELRNAVDTIAVEVERISENQRFVTALLSEKTPEQMAQLKAQVERGRTA